ncbi:hypothetical protein K502DRAFT_363210 [Neoconidiobolus thromboides FSU 785]|nr:hypothetical protein K502DRAFT_363210 [Neoconidiobolus thromboides FSU 785]
MEIESENEIPDYLLTNEEFKMKKMNEDKKKKKKRKPKETEVQKEEEEEIDEGYLDITVQGEPEIFNENKSFIERIYLAIERFRKKSKLTPKQNNLFHAYLNHGQVKVGIKPFINSIDLNEENENNTILKETNLIVGVDADDLDPEVDFLYSIHQFISECFILKPRYIDLVSFKLISKIILKFLNYLIASNSCPEYIQDINESIALLNKIDTQLPINKMLSLLLPDKFNISCSIYFEGQYSWILKNTFFNNEKIESMLGVNLLEAKQTIQDNLGDLNSKVVFVKKDCRMIVRKIEVLNESYLQLLLDEQHLGDYAQVDEEEQTYFHPVENWNYSNDVKIYLSIKFLPYCLERMVIQATFYQLENKLWFFDNFINIIPPFVSDDLPI